MKQFEEFIWTEKQENGTINIGFTQQFINRKMAECFHVLQADVRKIDKDGPLFVIETNEALESIKSPITGSVSYYNNKALNFPDRLKENDIIMTLIPPGVTLEKNKEKIERYENIAEWLNQPINMNVPEPNWVQMQLNGRGV